MAGGSSVRDVRIILWRLEVPSTAAEFDVGGWRPGGMISRVKEEEGGESRERQFDFVILSVVFCFMMCVFLFVVFVFPGQTERAKSLSHYFRGW